MVRFTPVLALISAAVVLAVPWERANVNAINQLARRTTVSSGTGTVDGYYYSLYEEVDSGVTMNIGDGVYSLTWNASSVDVVAGIGWNPGSAQEIMYNGIFSSDGNVYLSVYGWTTDPLVEYYICDSYGDYNPGTGLTEMGTIESDGALYNIYQTVRENAPSILGTQTFNQYWSVRSSTRVGGIISTGNHFLAWEGLNMSLGTFNYQILATEGYESSGSSSITVSVGPPGTAPAPTPTSPPVGEVPEWAQCGGIGYTGATVCEAPYTCQVQNPYFSHCLLPT